MSAIRAQLDAIPDTAIESFAGVGYPFAVGAIRGGHRVLDVGSGSGTDALIAPRAFAEIFRVLRPGGCIQISDIVLHIPITAKSRDNPKLWAECIVGAVLEDECLSLFRRAGFEDMKALGYLDYFSKSAEPDTREVAASFGAKTITLTGRKS